MMTSAYDALRVSVFDPHETKAEHRGYCAVARVFEISLATPLT
jgi:hypothetical protein